MRRLLVLASLCAGACLADGPGAPMDWAPVQTNAIARWKSENNAPLGVLFSAGKHCVRFLVEATGAADGVSLEFAAIGPLSDRAYESLFVTVASPEAIAAAFDLARIPRGVAVDSFRARLWPQGEQVSVTVAPCGGDASKAENLSAYLKDVRQAEEGAVLDRPVTWTAGARDAAGAVVAATNIPCAVFALYDHGPSLLQLNGSFNQTDTYGRFQSARRLEKGALYEMTVTWDGRRRVKDQVVHITESNVVDVVKSLQTACQEYDVYARLSFGDDITVGRAAKIAESFAVLNGEALRMNGRAPGQFYFCAFLPKPAWRTREGRISQPFEVHIAPDGSRTFVFCEEDWSGPGDDPVLKPRTTPFKDWSELPALIAATGEAGSKTDVMFLFAPRDTPVARLTPVIKALGERIAIYYVFGE